MVVRIRVEIDTDCQPTNHHNRLIWPIRFKNDSDQTIDDMCKEIVSNLYWGDNGNTPRINQLYATMHDAVLLPSMSVSDLFNDMDLIQLHVKLSSLPPRDLFGITSLDLGSKALAIENGVKRDYCPEDQAEEGAVLDIAKEPPPSRPPPGQGRSATQKRNARKRRKLLAEKDQEQEQEQDHEPEPEPEHDQEVEPPLPLRKLNRKWRKNFTFRAIECQEPEKYKVEVPPFPYVHKVYPRQAESEESSSDSSSDLSDSSQQENSVCSSPSSSSDSEREPQLIDDLQNLLPGGRISVKVLAMDPKTFSPEIHTYKCILKKNDTNSKHITVLLDQKHRQKPLVHADGTPILTRFPSLQEEDEADDGFRTYGYTEVLECKLV